MCQQIVSTGLVGLKVALHCHLVREVQDLALDPVMTLVISLGLNVIDLDRCPSYWDVMID